MGQKYNYFIALIFLHCCNQNFLPEVAYLKRMQNNVHKALHYICRFIAQTHFHQMHGM